jgi:hypothetical protein
MFAIAVMDSSLFAALMVAAFVLAVVVLVIERGANVLAWAAAIGFAALAWNAVAVA